MADTPHTTTTPTSAIIGWTATFLSLTEVDTIIRIIAGLIAIVSGCMAIRYYYYQTKKIK